MECPVTGTGDLNKPEDITNTKRIKALPIAIAPHIGISKKKESRTVIILVIILCFSLMVLIGNING